MHVVGSSTGQTILNGGIQINYDPGDTGTLNVDVSHLSIINGGFNPDWALPTGINARVNTNLTVDDVSFRDQSGDIDMVGVVASTAGPDTVLTVKSSSFKDLANAVDVENGISADISHSKFENATVVTNHVDDSDFFHFTDNVMGSHSGIVFVEGNQWGDLVIEDNKGSGMFYIFHADGSYDAFKDYDVNLQHAHVGDDGFFTV